MSHDLHGFSTYRFRGPRTGGWYAITVARKGEGAPRVVREYHVASMAGSHSRSLARMPRPLADALAGRLASL